MRQVILQIGVFMWPFKKNEDDVRISEVEIGGIKKTLISGLSKKEYEVMHSVFSDLYKKIENFEQEIICLRGTIKKMKKDRSKN